MTMAFSSKAIKKLSFKDLKNAPTVGVFKDKDGNENEVALGPFTMITTSEMAKLLEENPPTVGLLIDK